MTKYPVQHRRRSDDPCAVVSCSDFRRPPVTPRPVLPRVGLAVAAALLAVGVSACGGGTGPDGNGGGQAELSLDRATASFTALGEVVDLDVSGTNSAGESVGDGDATWTSTDPSVASVDPLGRVTAEANGTARIVASIENGSAADTADVTVDQQVAGVRVSPESAELPAIGDTAHFSAAAVDANGNDVPDVSIAWSSSDQQILEVDDAGVATARDTGEARVIASTPADSSGSARVEVAQPDPRIEAVAPETLDEGGAATITGSEFGSDASEIRVLIDGVEAAVTAAGDTELEVTVPQYDCLPLRSVDVQVVVGDDSSNVAGSAVRPDEATMELAAGEQRVFNDPSDGFCIQLGESAEDQTYLVGLQSVTDAVGLTSASLVQVVGGTDEAASGAAADRREEGDRWPEAGPREPGAGHVPSAGAAQAGLMSGLAGGSAPPEIQLRHWEKRHLGPHLASSIPRRWGADGPPRAEGADGQDPPLAAKIGANPSEGDMVSIRVPDISASNACQSWEEIQAVVRKVGTHAVWLEDVANPEDGFTDDDWQEFSDQFDDPVHGTDTDYFGEPTDIDSNDRIAVVVTKELNEFGGVLGFVFAGDLFPRQSDSGSSCQSSDEGELTYTLAPDPDAVFGDTVSVEAMRAEYPSLVAHEFTHIIQFGRRFECANCQFPAVWITEGQATLAEEVAGHAVTGRQTGQNYGFEVAFNANDTDDADWYRDRFVDMAVYYGFEGRNQKVSSAPHQCSWQVQDWAGPCLGGRGVYGVPSALLRWINDHLGGDYPGGEQGLQRDITGNDDVGFDNLEEITGESMKGLLADWGPMLWTDDRVPGVEERLTMPSWNLFDVFQNLVTPARLEPRVRSFADFSESFSVNAGSAAYYLVGGAGRPPVALKARTVGGGQLSSHMQMWVVRTK